LLEGDVDVMDKQRNERAKEDDVALVDGLVVDKVRH
jgi:hypothetical protein